MNGQRDVDTIIAGWLDDGPVTLPMDTRRAISVGVRTQPRARRMAFLGGFSMLPLNRVVAATVVVLAVGAGSVLFFSNRISSPAVGGPPTPTPTPTAVTATPSALITSRWPDYASDRYGFTIAHPADWSERPAQRDFTLENDGEAWLSNATESFLSPEGSVRFSAWSVGVAPGTELEAWMEAYCTASAGSDCSRVADRAVPQVTGDGHAGLGLFGPDDTVAFFLKDDVVYVTAIWRGETDPSVVPYGGARHLLEAYLSTMRLEAPSASASPSLAPPDLN